MILNFILLIITITFSQFLSCNSRNQTDANTLYYRSGIVEVDTLKLSDKTLLFKGDFVQIILNKTTEEGTYIKVKNDSGYVYYKTVATLCWPYKNIEVNIINSSELVKLKRTDWLIFEDAMKESVVVRLHNKRIRLKESNIYFDNKEFFRRIIN